MKPDQERIHTVLTDTISLMCRNGLNYEKELKVQGVIGVTIDGSEVFIVHINETFDTSSNDANVEFSSVGTDDCKMTTGPLPSRLTCRMNQRNMLTDYSHMTPVVQRSNRLGKMKSRHMRRMPGCTPSSASRSLPCSDAKSPMHRFPFSGNTDDGHSIERVEVGDFQECGGLAAPDGKCSESDTAKETETIICREANLEPFVAKEDGEEGTFRNYSSVASSLHDSSDTAVDSDPEVERNGATIGNGRIKVESEVNSADTDVRNEFSVSSNVPSLFPESQEFNCFKSDHKLDATEYQLSSEGHEPGAVPLHSRHLVHPLSPSQSLTSQRRIFPSQSRDFAASRKSTSSSSFPHGFGSAGSAPSEAQHDLWRLMARFVCDVPGCNTSFSNKQNLLRHQTHKHGRQKIPRQSRAAAHFFAANVSAGYAAAGASLPNFTNGSEG